MKIKATLVEKRRQDKWWNDDKGYVPRNYARPALNQSLLAATMYNQIYCLNIDYDYAVMWEYDIGVPVEDISSPLWVSENEVSFTVRLGTKEYVGYVLNTSTEGIFKCTLASGKKYESKSQFDRDFLHSPLKKGDGCIFVSPFSNVAQYPGKIEDCLGSDLSIRFQPVLHDNFLIMHIGNEEDSWIEIREVDTLRKIREFERHETLFGLFCGYLGTSPIINNNNVICGFGGQISSFDLKGNPNWRYPFPAIKDIHDKNPVKITTKDGEVIDEIRSEVDISSNLYVYQDYLFFVLSEFTRHISFITKMDIRSGAVLWSYRIEGYSFGFQLIYVDDNGLLLQNDRSLWSITLDGRLKECYELEYEGAGNSFVLKTYGDSYVFQSDYGIHEFSLDQESIN